MYGNIPSDKLPYQMQAPGETIKTRMKTTRETKKKTTKQKRMQGVKIMTRATIARSFLFMGKMFRTLLAIFLNAVQTCVLTYQGII